MRIERERDREITTGGRLKGSVKRHYAGVREREREVHQRFRIQFMKCENGSKWGEKKKVGMPIC